jgi:hypothetical protein
MIASDLIRSALVFSIPFVIQINIVLLYVVVILASSVKQFFDPAEQSVLPDVASEEELGVGERVPPDQLVRIDGDRLRRGRVPRLDRRDRGRLLCRRAHVPDLGVVRGGVHIAPMVVEEVTSVRAVVANLGSGISFLARTPIIRST